MTGLAAMFASGVAIAPAQASAQGSASSIRSAAAFGDGLVALTADAGAAAPYAIRHLVVDADQRVALGERLAVDLPSGFHPHSMAARDATLWITGAVDEAAADASRARPALLRIDGDRVAFAELPVPAQIRSGVATSLTLPGARGIAVAVEGCPDAEITMITRSHLAFSADDGRTWRDGLIVEGLGEGYGTVLAAVGDRILVVTADGAGTQTSYTGVDTALELVATVQGAGRPMAAIPTADGEVSVFSDSGGEVRETRFAEDGLVREPSGEGCGCAGEIVAVHGRLGARLEIDADTASASAKGL
ncbi:hypothetical protein [Glycomyces tenuis]|uniref:hypothetical protein n=1 Tax=Glycomyces tenuis TaxID=58116 RepID=UPI0003F636EE|nr:hypothetical protein [Glycomyces tenuis]